jgi:hypothetical protein
MIAADAERDGELVPEDNGAVNKFGTPVLQQMVSLEFGATNINMLDDTWIRDMFGAYDFNL